MNINWAKFSWGPIIHGFCLHVWALQLRLMYKLYFRQTLANQWHILLKKEHLLVKYYDAANAISW